MRAHTGLDEIDLPERIAVDHDDAVPQKVCDKEDLALGRDPDVLRHVTGSERQRVGKRVMDEIDLGERIVEFAGEDRIGAVRRKIGVIDARAVGRRDVALQLHRVRIAELEPPHRFGDDDRRLAVGGEIYVIRVRNVNFLAELAGPGVDRDDAAVTAAHADVG